MKPTQNNNVKKKINRIEIIEEDRTRYFGDRGSEIKNEKTEPEKKTSILKPNINPHLITDKKKIHTYSEENHRENISFPIGKILCFLFIICLLGGAGAGIYYFKDRIAVPDFRKNLTKNEVKKITGRVNGNEVEFTSEINGKVTELNVSKGIPVKEGELLAVIENINYKENLEKSEAELKNIILKNSYTQIETDEIKSVPVTTKKTVASSSAKKAYSKEILIAEEKFRNDREAYNAGLISRVEYERSAAEIKRARSREKAVSEKPVVVTETKFVNTKVTNKKAVPLERDKILAVPKVKEAIEKYKKAYAEYNETKICAQFSGIVKEQFIELGQEISQGQKLFKILSSSQIFVEAELTKKELGNAKIGTIVKLKSQIDQKEYEGVISEIKPSVTQGFNSIKILIDNKSQGKDNLISLGSNVEINITKKTAAEDFINNMKKQEVNILKSVNANRSKSADEKVQEIIDGVLKN